MLSYKLQSQSHAPGSCEVYPEGLPTESRVRGGMSGTTASPWEPTYSVDFDNRKVGASHRLFCLSVISREMWKFSLLPRVSGVLQINHQSITLKKV